MNTTRICLVLMVSVWLGGCDKPPPKTVEYYSGNSTERDATVNRCKGMADRNADFDCQNAMRAALAAANRGELGGIKFSTLTIPK